MENLPENRINLVIFYIISSSLIFFLQYLVHDYDGRLHFICRFLKPQSPPSNLKTLENICRYVSLVPYIPHSTVFASGYNIWSRSDVNNLPAFFFLILLVANV